MDLDRFLNPFWVHFLSKLGCENDEKRCVLLCFLDLGDSEIDPKIDTGKKASKLLPGAHDAAQTQFFILILGLSSDSGGTRVIPGGYHFKRFPSEENREESQQKGANKVGAKSGVQKAHTERQVQTGNPQRT